MTYPGDSKLSDDLRQRVESTFEQSLDLARQGKVQEALLGCEFVLRLDPLFEPARDFMQKLESGETGLSEDEPATEVADGEDGAGQELGLDSLAAPRVDLRSEFEDLLDRRDFRTLLSLAQEHQQRVVADPELRAMAEAATERLEAEPYVRAFLDEAEKAQREGNLEEAATAIEKARALDPLHPSLPPPSREPAGDEPNDRIAELLAEGQSALDRGDHQGAIDSWSRIFLIDIDHGEANARIEQARRLKAESERQIEEAFHEGVSLWELGSTDKAREQFEKVLSVDASHPGAKDYIRRMDARDVPDIPELGETAMPSGDAEIFAPPDDEPMSDDFEPAVEAPAAAEAPEGDDEPQAVKKAPAARFGSQLLSNRRFLGLAGLGVLVLLAVFGWLYMRRDDLFPNADEGGPVAQLDALEQARKLAAAGQTGMAIAQLGRLPSDHPQFAEAQALIAQWEAPVEDVPEEPSGPSELELAQRDQLVELARAARQNRENLLASRYYALAAKIAPLEDEDRLVQTEVEQRLAGLESQIELFEQGDWEFVLPDLWRLHRANPEDRDIVRLMVDSYYNLGVRDLQRGDTAAAAEKLERAVELDPLDAEVSRLLRFSEVYGSRPADLLYRIFVKYMPFR
jgi:tetratricopeptide (TPR) repeat protein